MEENSKKKAGDSSLLLFQRKIEFHPARKPFLGFSNNNPNFHLETLNPSSCSSSITTTSSDYRHPLTTIRTKSNEHGFDPELCFRFTLPRIGAGLENLGNTCFLNSVLQCLTYTEPFAAYLQSGKHKSSCHTAGFCAMCAIQNHVKQALQSTGRIVAPKHLVMNLRCISRSFRNARQEDAHEYMVNLLESMHKCCLPSGVPSESPSAYEKSLVHKIFGGRLRSQVKCMQCSHCSNKFDPFLDLSLEITKADSLPKALSHFTAVEQLDGGERQYQCERCKQKVKALKQLTVYKAPYVLSIHLKRFGSHNPGQKIDKKVEFGPTLDLKPYVTGSYEGDLKYTLYGVLVHAGWSTHSGHYYCFVRTPSGMWHSLDDNRVVQVSERTVLQQKAYMMFYVRDRKHVTPNKPIDLRENILPNINGSREHYASIKPKEAQNGQIATGLHNSDLTKKLELKEASTLKINKGLVTAEDPSVLKDQSSPKALVNGHTVKPSNNGPPLEEVHSKSTPSVEKINITSYPTVATSISKTSLERLHQGSKPVDVPPTCSGSQSSGPKKLLTNKNVIIYKEKSNEEPQTEVNDLKFEQSISAILSNQSGKENNQTEAERVPSEPLRPKAEENAPTSKEITLAERSTKSGNKGGCFHKDALGHRHCFQKLKSKKKIMKSRASMLLFSRFLMKASLSLYKKKKRNKQRNLELRSYIQENFDKEFNSTSEKTRMTELESTHSKRRQRKFSTEKGTGLRDAKAKSLAKQCVINVTDGELRERVYQRDAVLASDELPQKSSRTTSEEPGTSQLKKGLLENGLTIKLTSGPEEYSVARWDETESTPHYLGLKDGQSINIGYVPDEWDEEYDRGKRKKISAPKDPFDGSNPFQEIATEKAKLKKEKMDRTSSRRQRRPGKQRR